jgi:SSS family transporter
MQVGVVPPPPFDPSGGFVASFPEALVAAGRGADGAMVLWVGSADGRQPWQPTGVTVPRDAAVARHGGVWIVAGGESDGAPTPALRVLRLDGGAPVLDPLPDLPVALTGPAAAVIGEMLYVSGGSRPDGTPTDELLILDLANPAAGWQQGPALPGGPRVRAAYAGHNGMFSIFGGTGAGGGTLTDAWAYRPVPLEGTKDSGWKRLGDAPSGVMPGAATPLGQSQLLVMGAAQPLLYHTVTDAWCGFDASPGLAAVLLARTKDGVLALGTGSGGGPGAAELSTPRSVRNLTFIDYGMIVGYFVAIFLIGVYFSRKQDTSAEFSLGNRQVKWWAAGISMFATGASAISFIAIPALAFSTNLVWLFPLVALIPGYYVTAYLIYPMLRRLEIASTYEYLERRFNRALRVIASLQAIIFQSFVRAAVVLLLPSLAIASVTGINVYTSVLIMGVVTTIYTAIGGFEAVIWTEVLQAVLMLLAPLAIIWVCITSLPGGFGEFWATSLAYSKFDFAVLSWDLTVPAVWMLVLGTFLTTTVASAGDQPVIQRVFSAPLPEVRRVNATFTVCGIIIGIMVNVMGIAIFTYFRAHPEMLDPLSQNDQIVPLFVTQAMPLAFPGIVIAAIFAAAMSTVASSMNSVATIFTEDFYVKMRPQSSDKERLLTLKIGSYVVGIIGTIMALLLAAQDVKSMMVVWNQMVALVGGGVVGVYSLGMFSTRANGFGAICGALASVIITLIVRLYTPLHWGTYIPIAIFSCIIVGYLASLLRPQSKDLKGLTVFTPSRTSA